MVASVLLIFLPAPVTPLMQICADYETHISGRQVPPDPALLLQLNSCALIDIRQTDRQTDRGNEIARYVVMLSQQAISYIHPIIIIIIIIAAAADGSDVSSDENRINIST